MKVNIGGVWKAGDITAVNIGGVWKNVVSTKVNIGGVWKDAGVVLTSTLMTFDTTKTGGSASTHLILPLAQYGVYDFIIDWGDGNSDHITAYNNAAIDHTYASAGTYDVTLTGTCIGWTYAGATWAFAGNADKLKLMEIKRWGIGFGFGENDWNQMFHSCANLVISATDVPHIAGSTTFQNMFLYCAAIYTIPNINTWDVHTVTDMRDMFDSTHIDADISGWDVTALTTASDMFWGVTLSVAHYDALLIGWAAQAVHANVPFSAGNSKYTGGGTAAAARAHLVTTHGWTITDGGTV